VDAAGDLGWAHVNTAPSRLPGPSGNREFFVHLVGYTGDDRGARADHEAGRASIVRAVEEATR
jgi:hypothetical protein